MQHKQFPIDRQGDTRRESVTNKPLVTCSYGWKRTCVLYSNRIDVDGTIYALDDLVHVRSIYRTVMNIPSIRLELRFRTKDVVLRGIAAIEEAKSIVAYLDTYCADITHATAQVRWKRNRQESQPVRVQKVGLHEHIGETLAVPLFSPIHEHAQATTAPIEAPAWLQDLEQHVVYTREQQHTKTHRSIRKYGFDVQELAQQVEADTLPSVAVPVRLLPQEIAHYCTDATLAREIPVAVQSQQARHTYTATDHGRLILTSTRIIYIGRTGQIVLDYSRLTHVSRLHNAIVFSADHWSKRHVFEMSRPLECALYLDKVLRQFQRRSARQAVHVRQQSSYEPTLQHTRTTQPRYAAYSRQTTSVRPNKHVVEVEDIETLPLSLLNRSVEVVE